MTHDQQSVWAGDLLTRHRLSASVRKVVTSMTSGGAFGIDAPFGHGKTFFVSGFAAELKKDGYPVVYFDAWKADLTAHPLFLFVSEVLAQLATQGISIAEKPDVAARVGKLASAVARIGLKTVLRAGDRDLDELVDPFVAEVDRLDFAKRGTAAEALSLAGEVEEAKNAFSAAVEALIVEPQKKLPLLVVVDELDRVRPDFAIDFLEAIKFVFSTQHVVFCVSVDRRNLIASLKARFGERYDVDQYLARLFSFWVQLQNPQRNTSFMIHALKRRGLIADRILDESGTIDAGVTSLAEAAIVAMGHRAENLRAMERCAERATICARAFAPHPWAGLIGFLSGLSVSNPTFLHEYASPTHVLKLRGRDAVMTDVKPDFLDRLEEATRGADRWIKCMAIAWAFQPSEVAGLFDDLSEVYDQQTATQAVGAANELMGRRHLYNQSAASLVYAEVGWALG